MVGHHVIVPWRELLELGSLLKHATFPCLDRIQDRAYDCGECDNCKRRITAKKLWIRIDLEYIKQPDIFTEVIDKLEGE